MLPGLPRVLLSLAVLAAVVSVVCFVVDGWRSAVLFTGVALVCAGSLTFRTDGARPATRTGTTRAPERGTHADDARR